MLRDALEGAERKMVRDETSVAQNSRPPGDDDGLEPAVSSHSGQQVRDVVAWVARLTASSAAISSVDFPSARWRSTSSCRFVSEIDSPPKPLLGDESSMAYGAAAAAAGETNVVAATRRRCSSCQGGSYRS